MSRHIDDAFEEASKLAGSPLPPTEFFEKFLNRTISAISAPAGAVWMRTPQGFLQIACQINLESVGLDARRGGRQCHNEILRQVFQAAPPRPVMVEPQGRLSGIAEPGPVPAANLTEYYTLFAPIVAADKAPLGLLEIFQESSHDPRMYPTFLNYAVQMAGYASQYHSYSNARQAAGIDKAVTGIESFARLIHTSLNPTEVAYHVANEGRKLVESDRVSVAVRHGKKVTVEAVSGADVVEKASTHVRRMRALFDAVIAWGEKLVYSGEKDESLPPQVLHALDDYLAESQPKLLVVQPIRDSEREKDDRKPARSALMMELFNPPEQTDPYIQRLDLVGKHAAPALFNAAEMKRVPLKFLWWPIAKVQDGLGGKTRFYWTLGTVAAAILIACLILIPAPLKMEAKGELQPVNLRHVFAGKEGTVKQILVDSGRQYAPGTGCVLLYDAQYQKELIDIKSKWKDNIELRNNLQALLANSTQTDEAKTNTIVELTRANAEISTYGNLLTQRLKVHNGDPNQPGYFTAITPQIDDTSAVNARWTVLNADTKEYRQNTVVKGNEPLLKLGWVEGPWHVVLKIPQRNMGHVLRAFELKDKHHTDETGKAYLDVDILITSQHETRYPGRLYRDQITQEAVPNKDDHNESDQVILAHVKVNLPGMKAVPHELLVSGQEIHSRIKCGDERLGYSLFHGVYEWFYEKVVFPWF
ncbi:MAG: hypothetical protein U0798_02190 [Gemmataceae bacterium]